MKKNIQIAALFFCGTLILSAPGALAAGPQPAGASGHAARPAAAPVQQARPASSSRSTRSARPAQPAPAHQARPAQPARPAHQARPAQPSRPAHQVRPVASPPRHGAHPASRPSNYQRPPPRHAPPVGQRVQALPPGHRAIVHHGVRYHYYAGTYYRPTSYGYSVVAPPLGFRIAALPVGYVTYYLNGRPYFAYNDVYYSWNDSVRQYEVIAAPQASGPQIGVTAYPTYDIGSEQQARDRYECHSWAVQESGFDPSVDRRVSHDALALYNNSLRACFETRGYYVE